MITRRTFVAACGCLICAPTQANSADTGCVPTGQRADDIRSRIRTVYSYAGGTPKIIHGSGDKLLDLAFAVALHRLSLDFQVMPGFAYVDDKDGENAFAYKDTYLNHNDGTVLFGINYLRRIYATWPHPDAIVVGITAHEFAHIVQFKRKFPARPDDKRHELHADYLSGWYGGLRKLKNPNFPSVVFAEHARRLGSWTHGSSEERAAAVEAGFLAAARDKLTLDQAYEAGIRHIDGGFAPAPVVPHRS